MAEMNKVPAIRFGGFSEEWSEKNLSEIATMKARIGWQGLTKKEYLDSGNFYLITGTDFLDGSIDFKNCHYVNEDRYAQDANIQIKNDDVLITKDGTIGKVAYVDNLDKPATLNAGVFVIRGKDKSVCNLYLYQYLAAPYLLDFANKQATGGTIKHLNQNVLVKFPVPISNVYEQTQIGDYFQHLDKLISLHQAKVNKLTNLKKAMLEKMFPKQGTDVPEIRFKGFARAWKEVSLGEICEGTFGGGTPKTSQANFWYGDTPWIQSSDLTEGKLTTITPTKHVTQEGIKGSATKLIPKNSIAIVTRVGIGKLALVPFAYTTSQDFLSLSWLKIDKDFAVYAIWKKIQEDLHIVQGTSIKGITKEEALTKVIKVPTEVDEQNKIGSYFFNLDKSISLHQTELEKLGNLKKACLEKMFV